MPKNNSSQNVKDDMIRVDVNNLLRKNLGGEGGIKENEISGLEERAEEAHRSLQRRRPGFMDLPFNQDDVVENILDLRNDKLEDFDNFVVLGIGGSALGNKAVQTALNPPHYNENKDQRGDNLRLYVPDNVDPVRFSSLLESLDLERTLFNVISKSGTTAETMSLYLVARRHLEEDLGEKRVKEHFIATTSADSGYLLEIAEREGYPQFYIPEDVGGRFSVLSPVGLVSAAFCGVDIRRLLAGAASMAERCEVEELRRNPAYLHGALQYLAYMSDYRLSVMMPYSHLLSDVADWYRQLWAESLGKAQTRDGEQVNTGPTPIKALGATDQHSQLQLYMEGPEDKIINFIEVKEHPEDIEIPELYGDLDGVNYLGGQSLSKLLNTEKKATERALTAEGRPNCTILMPRINSHTLGQLFYLLEMETAFAGELFNVNAFNQPGVELGKNFTYGVMGRSGYEDMKEEFERHSDRDDDLIV